MNNLSEIQIALKEYSTELGLNSCLTLRKLIDSHREMREERINYTKNVMEARQEAFDLVIKSNDDRKVVVIDTLLNLTLNEIFEMLKEQF